MTYTNNTAVGTATATATYAGDANHNRSGSTRSFLITAPPVPFTIVNPGPQVNTERDKVSLVIQVVGAAPTGGVFAARVCLMGLYITQLGVIRDVSGAHRGRVSGDSDLHAGRRDGLADLPLAD